MESEGVNVQAIGTTLGKRRKGAIARAILAVILFGLVTGLWTRLWVPLAPGL